MSVSYKIDRNKRLVVSTVSGVFSARDVVSLGQHVLADPAFDPEFCMLADLTRVTKVDILPDEVRILAAMSPFVPHARRAFVVATDHQDLKLLELLALFQAHRRFFGQRSVQMFSSREAALRWLFPKAKATQGFPRRAAPPAA